MAVLSEVMNGREHEALLFYIQSPLIFGFDEYISYRALESLLIMFQFWCIRVEEEWD